MGINTDLEKELDPVTWKDWICLVVFLILFVVFSKGCLMFGEELQKANDDCCKKHSCSWLFKGNCGSDRY